MNSVRIRSCDFVRMNKSEIQKVLTVLDHLQAGGRSGFIDSSRARQIELDKTLASMLEEAENKRADQLQKMVAEELQTEELDKEKREGKLHTVCSCPRDRKEKEE